MTTSFQLLTIYWPGIRLVGNVTTAVVLLYGGDRVINGDMGVGVLAAFVLYLRQFFEPMAEVSQFYDAFQGAAAGIEKLAGVLDERPSVLIPEVSRQLPDGLFRGAVEFDHVGFGYRTGREILHEFSLSDPGRRRPSRCSGTPAPARAPLARLLARFYDPNEGAVTRRRHRACRDLAEIDLRRAVAMVTQESFMFAGIGRGQHRVRAPGRDPRGDRGGRAGGRCRRRRLASARRLRRERRQERRAALRRPAPADRPRPSAARRPGRAHPRRGELVAGRADRAAGAERPATVLADRTALIIAHRLSTVGDRRPGAGDGRRPDHRGRRRRTTLLAAGTGEYAALAQAWRESLV